MLKRGGREEEKGDRGRGSSGWKEWEGSKWRQEEVERGRDERKKEGGRGGEAGMEDEMKG